MRRRHRLLALGCLLSGLYTAAAWSGPVTVQPVYSGEVQYTYRTYLLPPDFPPVPPEISYRHDAPLESLLQAEYSSAGCLCSEYILTHGYVIFDLATLPFTVVEASLELQLDVDNFYDPRALQLHTVDDFTPAFLMGLPTGGVGGLPESLGEAIFDDLAQGTFLGTVDISGGSGDFSLALGAPAIDLINGAGGLLALGLAHTPGEIAYDELVFTRQPRLVLRDASTAVPLPATTWLLLAAFAAHVLRRARSGPTRFPLG